MGLDINLVKIVKHSGENVAWMDYDSEIDAELFDRYQDFLSEKIIEYDSGETEKVLGFYYKDISYQRKGVKNRFFRYFKEDDYVFTLKRMELLTTCIQEDTLASFQTEFIDRFKEGENFVWISW